MINIELINISLSIIPFHSLWEKDFGLVTKHKALEMQLMRDGSLIGFELDTTWSGRSHAGPRLSIALLFHRFDITFYDKRHWNYDANRWETPEETKAWSESEPAITT